MKQKNMLDIKINIVNKNEFKTYQNEIEKIFEENFLKMEVCCILMIL